MVPKKSTNCEEKMKLSLAQLTQIDATPGECIRSQSCLGGALLQQPT